MYLRPLCVAALVVVAAACSDVFAPREDLEVATLQLSVSDTTLTPGLSFKLLITARNAAGGVLSSPALTLNSRNGTVASVSEAGVITAVNPGVTYVVVSARSVADSVRIHVPDVAVASLELYSPADTTLVEGEDFQLRFVARNVAGDSIAAPAMNFVSRDPLTASVSNAGRVTALSEGETWIVLSTGSVADSLRVTASFRQVKGRVALRTSGPLARVGRLTDIWSVHRVGVASETGNQFSLQADDWNAGISFLLNLTGSPTVGARSLSSLDLSDVMVGAELGNVAGVLVITQDEVFVHASVDGQVVIEEVTAGSGTTLGTVRGRLEMRAATFRETPSGWQPTGDTVRVVSTLWVSYYEDRYGQVRFTVIGGPVTRDDVVVDVPAFSSVAGRVTGWFSDFRESDAIGVFVNLGSVSGTGTILFEAFDPNVDLPYEYKPVVILETFSDTLHHGRPAFPTAGSAQVTTFTTPAGLRFGEMEFVVEVDLAFWEPAPSGGWTKGTESARLVASFHVPIEVYQMGRADPRQASAGRQGAINCASQASRWDRIICSSARQVPGNSWHEQLKAGRAVR
jgi:hypothetical protein